VHEGFTALDVQLGEVRTLLDARDLHASQLRTHAKDEIAHEVVRERWVAAVAEPRTRTLIAVSSEEPAGAACVSEGWLDGLYVVPELWGTGLADELHGRALDLVGALGSASCKLWVLEDNIRARRFYERRGWRENGETRVVEFPPNPLDIGYSLDF
jgi:GNAT superfamily N-acetyltransferase